MQVLNQPTDWDCIIEATMTLSGHITKTLLSGVFPVKFSACVNPSDSCKLNTYSDNLLWVTPSNMNVWTDGLPVTTSINTDLCIDKIQTLCTDPTYTGNKGAAYTTKLCATASYELYNAATYATTKNTLA